METELCPECNYPMTKKLIRKGSSHVKRIETYACELCGHVERVPPSYEFARSCIGNPIPKNPE